MMIENINVKANFYAAERAATLPFFSIILCYYYYLSFLDIYYLDIID
jgi:hypothetical protein